MTLRVAALQFFATPLALERNLQMAERLAREAAAKGAQIIVLPEFFNTGYVYTPRLWAAAESENGPTLRWLTRLAAELQIVVGGALLGREGSHLFDTFLLVEPGGQIHRYHKQHLFAWEPCFFEAGSQPGLMTTEFGRVGLLIGWDAAFGSAWKALRGQADLVLISSAPPRLHRAVLNFPEARKVYIADLLPEVLPVRDEIDNWYLDSLGRAAAYVGMPVVSSTMAGRLVTEIPFPRLSFGLAALSRPRYLPWTRKARLATLRATFYGTSAVFDQSGEQPVTVAGEEGYALAELEPGVAFKPEAAAPIDPIYMFLHIPKRLHRLAAIMRLVAGQYQHNKPNQS